MGTTVVWKAFWVALTIILSVGMIAASGGGGETVTVNGVTLTGELAANAAPNLTVEPGWEPPRDSLTAEEINGSFYWPDE